MKYTLYIGENCHDCKKVCKTIVEMRLDIAVKNLDEGDQAPIDLFILPALFDDQDNLRAYGTDIVDFIKNPKNKIDAISWYKKLINFAKSCF